MNRNKMLLIGLLTTCVDLMAYGEESSNEFARQLIESNGGEAIVAGRTGTINSAAILRDRMLTDSVDEVVRVSFAMQRLKYWERNRAAVIAGETPDYRFVRALMSNQDYSYTTLPPKEVRKVLYNRLRELIRKQKPDEQDADAKRD